MTSVASVNVFEDTSDNPPFEGPEKLLEAWFASSDDAANVKGNGLRKIPRSVWEDMLDLVRCKVLSVIQGEEVDAYLLSESSMFVWPHKIILKTCGTTTLLLGLDRLLAIAKEYCGFNDVWRCFYSRKAFMFPERQQGPHKTWDDEVKFLDKSLGHGSGSAYCVGKMNGDHWLLYLTAPRDEPEPIAVDEESLVQQMLSYSLGSPVASSSKLPSTSSSAKPPSPPDQTLEILMTELDGSACKEFFYPEDTISAHAIDGVDDQQGHPAGTLVSKRLGIDKLLPGATVDSFLFTPCGYSANIVKEDRYATIHVTPESEWSYASFECNVDFRGTADTVQNGPRRQQHDADSLHILVENVLGIFRPGRFSLTLFVSVEESNAGVDAGTTPETRQILDPRIADGYTRTDRILYEFAGYHLLFSTFVKQK